jgi:uncharacterized FlaG/YvyC family protein
MFFDMRLESLKTIVEANIQKAKHVEFKTVVRNGKTYVQRYNKNDEDADKPSNILETKNSELINTLVFSHYHDGEFYDSKGKHLKLGPGEKEYAKTFHRKEGMLHKIGAAALAMVDKKLPGLAWVDLSDDEKEKYEKMFKTQQREHFVKNVLPRIEAGKKAEEEKQQKKVAKTERHKDLDRIIGRIKDNVKRLNEGYTFHLNDSFKDKSTEQKGVNIEILHNVVSHISNYFNTDPTVSYKLNGKAVEEKLSAMKERLGNRKKLNAESKQSVITIWHPNKKKLEFSDFKIHGLEDMDKGDFNESGSTTVKY